jgi:hypothetical protein
VAAVDYRYRGCHLCFNTQHFLMDCPLLGAEVRQLAQQQRDQKVREPPARREPSAYPRTSSRPPVPMRSPEPRRPPVAVNPVVEETSPAAEESTLPELPSEN